MSDSKFLHITLTRSCLRPLRKLVTRLEYYIRNPGQYNELGEDAETQCLYSWRFKNQVPEPATRLALIARCFSSKSPGKIQSIRSSLVTA